MIIKREYVPFWKLQETDKEAMAIFDKAFSESYIDLTKEEKEQQYKNLIKLCLYQREMDWAFDKILDVINAFNKLDKDKPYDNGLNYEDVNSVEIANKTEEDITLHLIKKIEDVSFIVKVVNISNIYKSSNILRKDSNTEIVELYLAYKQGQVVSFSTDITKTKEFLIKVAQYLIKEKKISTSALQRKFCVGFPRAAKTMDLFKDLQFVENKPLTSNVITSEENIKDFIVFLEKHS